MSCRFPVIASLSSGVPRVVLDCETGLIIDGDDPDELLECLVRLCSNSELRAQMDERGRHRVEQHYNRTIQMRKVCELLEGLIR
ncbi:glycosyltransferase [Novipirellula rosea]|uniref:glycosyltransferase n=1 Tax=Novipirellula rosea TaxID=1031540 RepID=UPI003CD06EE9